MRNRASTLALLLIGVGVVLGATVFRTDIAQATGLAQSVTVNNTASNPVPVAEQNLDGNGNIKVHENGTASVKVTNTPAVIEDGTPVQAEQQYPFNLSGDSFANYLVPDGKRLRIDLITLDDLNSTSGVARFSVRTTVGGNVVTHYLATSTQAADGDVATDQVAIYADPGTTVHFSITVDIYLSTL